MEKIRYLEKGEVKVFGYSFSRKDVKQFNKGEEDYLTYRRFSGRYVVRQGSTVRLWDEREEPTWASLEATEIIESLLKGPPYQMELEIIPFSTPPPIVYVYSERGV